MNIRQVSLCVLKKDSLILVEEIYDSIEGSIYYRPIGGTIEYGERSIDTVKREVQEEIGATITDLKLLGIIENIFTWHNQIGHEIDFIYEARFEDVSLYNKEIIQGLEGNKKMKVVWVSIETLKCQPERPLVPNGLLDMLL
ncbi:TPA: NUDIX domain-containing protein [Bacillus thuringiensis]|uniref:NUDIX hydrolase n=1 Tax=Bacillus thuringiensis TaxID=1428 RepID=UPI000BF8B116|nr:NUDIX domain-containing protein [Bacillus thuringiensis]PER45758.1 hypothetical protein CN472_17635 [Bacillus thuringiensis]PFI45862.1 hypothetical protein COI76_29440 [Bacillus cereus]HDX9535848.1 NUDIX domain-containing protein [Bacillus thuringiensis]